MKKIVITNTEEIQRYIKDIKKIPIMSHEKQEEIFNLLINGNLNKKEKEKLYDELVVGNLRFVISIAKTYQNNGVDLVDLISEGNIGLIKAAQRFDPSSGFKFISYAVWWIRQSIMSYLNDNARTIRLPSNLVQDAQKKKKEETNEEDNFLINDDDKLLSPTLPYCVGLNNPINEDGDELIDVIPNLNANNPENVENSIDEIKKRVSIMLSVLDERERVIIEKSYGLSGHETSLEELGEEFGCTKERIRQLRDKSIKKLRNVSYDIIKHI